jgi:hypothetical protein
MAKTGLSLLYILDPDLFLFVPILNDGSKWSILKGEEKV